MMYTDDEWFFKKKGKNDIFLCNVKSTIWNVCERIVTEDHVEDHACLLHGHDHVCLQGESFVVPDPYFRGHVHPHHGYGVFEGCRKFPIKSLCLKLHERLVVQKVLNHLTVKILQ